MKKSKQTLRIEKAEKLKKYQLELSFSDGTSRVIDFENFLTSASHPEIRKFLKPTLFKTFKIVDGELMWGDFDLLFPITDLHQDTISKKKSQSSKVS